MKRPDIKSYLKKRLTETGTSYKLTNLRLKNYSADQDNYIDHLEFQRKELINENDLLKKGYKQISDFMNNNLKNKL